MGESTDSVDRISDLPVHILHDILEFLPTKYAARTCILSKRWQHIWETFPVLDCNELSFGKELYVINANKNSLLEEMRAKISDLRVKFMSYIDYKLRRFCQENVHVKKFQLSMTLSDFNLASQVDIWLELITALRVEELHLVIIVGNGSVYSLPSEVLTSQSLTTLSLFGHIQSPCFSNNVNKLQSLTELNLSHAIIDEATIRNLLSCLHLLEVFSLKSCSGFKRLEIYSHDKLKKMKYCSLVMDEVEKVSIEIPTLEELEYHTMGGDEMVTEINISSVCQNLKRLSLKGIPICGKRVPGAEDDFNICST